MWITSQLSSVAQSNSCSKVTAVDVLQFLAAIAFVEMGPKSSKSKLAPVKLLATAEVEISKEVRTFAVARGAALATDRLPCASVVQAGGDDTEKQKSDLPEGSNTKETIGKSKAKKQPKQKYQAHTCLVSEV